MADDDRFSDDIGPDPRAVTFLESKGLQRSWRWASLWREQHAFAFTLAGVHRLDVLAAAQQLTAKAVENGETLESFRSQFEERLNTLGFAGPQLVTEFEEGPRKVNLSAKWRTRVIYDTNVRAAYAAAEWTAIEETKGDFPALEYQGVDDERTRASHERWFGVVLPVDHLFWSIYYPPNDWFCRCYVIQISFAELESGAVQLTSAAELARRGFDADPKTWPIWKHPATGREDRVPPSVGAGFAYNAGQARRAAVLDLLARKVEALTPDMAAAAAGDVVNLPMFRDLVEDAVALGRRKAVAGAVAAKAAGRDRTEMSRLARAAAEALGPYPGGSPPVAVMPADLRGDGPALVVVNGAAIGHAADRHPTEPADWSRLQPLLQTGSAWRGANGDVALHGVVREGEPPWTVILKRLDGLWRVKTFFRTGSKRPAKYDRTMQRVRD